ncbi:MAG: Hpt domain-containing protein [Oscillibacter sp.]
MDDLIEKLTAYGGDMDGAMGRFVDDAALYESCFTVFLADEAFPKLGEALETSDYEKAFEYAHTLKGVTGNMGLTPLYEVICQIVEGLRGKHLDHLQEDYAEVTRQLSFLKTLA